MSDPREIANHRRDVRERLRTGLVDNFVVVLKIAVVQDGASSAAARIVARRSGYAGRGTRIAADRLANRASTTTNRWPTDRRRRVVVASLSAAAAVVAVFDARTRPSDRHWCAATAPPVRSYFSPRLADSRTIRRRRTASRNRNRPRPGVAGGQGDRG